MSTTPANPNANSNANPNPTNQSPTFGDRDTATAPGHWVLARIGKTVLRPGGWELTSWLLDHTPLAGKRVLEFAPGLGLTATRILTQQPVSYTGVDEEPDAIATASARIGDRGYIHQGSAKDTGLPAASVDTIVGEAMLSMQGEKGKAAIMQEAFRLLTPGGTYSIHELGLRPDDLPAETKTEIRKALARAIHVNARPLTITEWTQLLEEAGFEVEVTNSNDMHLLEPRRVLADEGLRNTLRIMKNVLTQPDVRQRVLEMRATFRKYENELCAVALVARKPETPTEPTASAPESE